MYDQSVAPEPETQRDNAPVFRKLRFWHLSLLILCFLFLLCWYSFTPPRDFPENGTFIIDPGLSASAIADKLKAESIVRSSTVLYVTLLVLHDPNTIQAGTYVFNEPISVFSVADRVANDAPEVETVSVTFPEGFSNEDFARIASQTLPAFDSAEFLVLASTSEGFLFPDTYFVPPTYSAEELFTLLRTSYDEKTADLQTQVQNNKLTEIGIIILASILEREANSPESMKLVAGILDTRLVIGMPLQVDATMEYVLDKPLSELTPEDLKIDSPYNTYLYRGLPPTPIGNPGLQAIEAVLNPTPSEYLYYITDENGIFYYAETFDQHRANIARYLR